VPSDVLEEAVLETTEDTTTERKMRYSNVPVGFVPTPTREYRIHQRSQQVTRGMRVPAAAPRSTISAVKVPGPIPKLPRMQGARVLMWKQDPTVQEIGIRKAYLPDPVFAGPHDVRIGIQGMTPVTPNVFGDLIEIPGTPAFDSVHTFTVVRQTLTMYQRALGSTVPWQWNASNCTDPLSVYPHAGVTQNAYYSRNEKALKFFYFDTQQPAPHTVFTCESLDIVSHETGHAVLDGLKPNWLMAAVAQTGALHEAFGDLTAIFLAMSQFDQVEAVIAQTKANLHDKTFLSDLAEEFGLALGRTNGLRNADNDLKLSQVTNEVHDLSQCFTGTIYDVLADWFLYQKMAKPTTDPAFLLYGTAAELRMVLLKAIAASPAASATFTDVANQMLNVCANLNLPVQYRNSIRNQFTRREIVVQTAPFTEDHKVSDKLEPVGHVSIDPKYGQDRAGCCGTMQLPEYFEVEDYIKKETNDLKAASKAA